MKTLTENQVKTINFGDGNYKEREEKRVKCKQSVGVSLFPTNWERSFIQDFKLQRQQKAYNYCILKM